MTGKPLITWKTCIKSLLAILFISRPENTVQLGMKCTNVLCVYANAILATYAHWIASSVSWLSS